MNIMKVLKSCILVFALIAGASGLMGCNNTNDTLNQVTVTPATQTMAKGTKQQFSANGTFTNGMVVAWTQVVNWISSDTTVATIDNTPGLNGIVTSVGYGTTIITAHDVANNITGTAMLTVADPQSVMIFPANTYIAVGSAHQFSAIALFSSATITEVITTFATWTTSSPGVATIVNTAGVAGNGVVTAGAVPGITDLQATDPISGATGTTTITVTSTPIVGLTVSPVTPIIPLSTATTQQFTAIGTFQDGSLTPSLTTAWAWSSSNTAVATIDYYTGLATDLITGVVGSTTLTFQ
jgi:hypothetical protein